MKKIIALCLVMVFALVGCSSGGVSQAEYDKLKAEYDAVVAERDGLKAQAGLPMDGSTVTDDSSSEIVAAGEFDEASVVKQLKVTEYNFVNSIKTAWTVLVVENSSKFNLDVGVEVMFKDAAGNLIGAKNDSQEAVQGGFETVFTFMNDEKPASMEYVLTAKQEEYYGCVQSDLAYKVSNAKDKAIISVTNNGKETAEFVEYNALFFQQGKLVYCSSGYAMDDDSELKPGKTINDEARCYEPFDEVKVVLTGRR